MQLQPREKFTIARQIEDPLDANTYYVRAYIRNAHNDTLLDTLDLEDKGDQRFRVDWDVPEDGSGEGFYVTITTKVYTDSGYTTESDTYGREEREYLIQMRYNHAIGGGGGGSDVDYKKVREIVKEELRKIEFPKPAKPVDLTSLKMAVDEAKTEIMMIDIPKPEKVDLSPISREISSVKQQISDIYIPKPEKVDLSGLEKAIKDSHPVIRDTENKVKQIIDNIKKFFDNDINSIKDKINNLEKKLNSISYFVLDKKQTNETKKTRKFF